MTKRTDLCSAQALSSYNGKNETLTWRIQQKLSVGSICSHLQFGYKNEWE